jgi:nitrite reductase/ring-hydroxylating ferredoxin subunit
MSKEIKRRTVLGYAWKGGIAVLAGAWAWTTWDLLQPLETTGFGGKVRAVTPEAVPEQGVVPVPAARAYLTRLDGEIVALSEKCTHLGCRVPYCESSSQFECPCHGSVFNRAGELLSGPSPRGLDRYPTQVEADGLVYIDTGEVEDGPPPGTDTIDEPATGPACATEEH